MRWPSEVLKEFADKLDGWEDTAYDRYVDAGLWARGWKVWEWHGQQQRIEALRNKNRALVDEYKSLRDAYRKKTGEEPPWSIVLVLCDDDGIRKAMDQWREAVNKAGDNIRAAWGLGR